MSVFIGIGVVEQLPIFLLAVEEERKEFSVLTAFFLSIVLTVVAIIPCGILAAVVGVE